MKLRYLHRQAAEGHSAEAAIVDGPIVVEATAADPAMSSSMLQPAQVFNSGPDIPAPVADVAFFASAATQDPAAVVQITTEHDTKTSDDHSAAQIGNTPWTAPDIKVNAFLKLVLILRPRARNIHVCIIKRTK
jgi:hypothetical protein